MIEDTGSLAVNQLIMYNYRLGDNEANQNVQSEGDYALALHFLWNTRDGTNE
jgi:hypothetical protein